MDTIQDDFIFFVFEFGIQQLISNFQVITSSNQIPRDFLKQMPYNPTTVVLNAWFTANILASIMRKFSFFETCEIHVLFLELYELTPPKMLMNFNT